MQPLSRNQHSTQASDPSPASSSERDKDTTPLSDQLATMQLSTPEKRSIHARTVFKHIESLTLTFLPGDKYQERPPHMMRRDYHPIWHLGHEPQVHSSEGACALEPEYSSEPVNLTTKALSCFLEKSFYKLIPQSDERIHALSCLQAFTQSSDALTAEHKALLNTFWDDAIKIEKKACQLLDSARKAGVNLRHHDELFPLIMDHIFHHVGRHAFDDAPGCMLALLDGIQEVFEHAQKGLFITEPPPRTRTDQLSPQQSMESPTQPREKSAIPSREVMIDNSIRYLKKINKLVGGPGEFSFSSFPISTDHKSNFSIAALKEITSDARIVCFSDPHRKQTANYLDSLDLKTEIDSINVVDENKPLKHQSTEGKRWLLTANSYNKQLHLYFPDTNENTRSDEAKRLFGQFYLARDKAQYDEDPSIATQKARLQLLQALDRTHLFRDGNGRNNICLDLSLRLMLGHTLKMPRQVSDYARFTVEELYQREIDSNPPDHAFDLIATCSDLKLTHIAKYLLEVQRQWLIDNHDITHQLQAACRMGDIETARQLIAQGANVNKVSEALLWQPGTTALNEAIKSGDYTLVKYLLDSGADVNLSSRDGILPFDIANHYGFESIATQLMLRNGKMSTLPGEVNPDWYR